VVRSFVVEPVHPGSSPRPSMGVCIYLDLFQNLTGDMLSVVGDVPVRLCQPQDMSAQSLEGVHRDKVCVRAFIGMFIRACL
jgi:hypothetical protein